jgi:hypothetical protein
MIHANIYKNIEKALAGYDEIERKIRHCIKHNKVASDELNKYLNP